MVAEATWRTYLPTVFGPFLKKNWPTSAIMKKPKFQVMKKWFSHFLFVWRDFRKKIPSIIQKLGHTERVHLQHLCDLFEFFIPLVLWFERTKNSDDFSLRLKFVHLQLFALSALNSPPYVKVKLKKSAEIVRCCYSSYFRLIIGSKIVRNFTVYWK